MPFSILLAVFRKEILGTLYLRGAFGAMDLETTSTVFVYFAATLAVAALEPVFVRTCFTFADTRTPLIATIAASFVMIPLMSFLAPLMGIAGIGLSAALGLLVDVGIQVLVLDKRFCGLFVSELVQCFARSFMCAGLLLPLLLLWPAVNTIQVCAATVVYAGAYAVLASYLSRDGVKALTILWVRECADRSRLYEKGPSYPDMGYRRYGHDHADAASSSRCAAESASHRCSWIISGG